MSKRVVEEIAIDKLVCRPQVRESSGLGEEELAGLAQSIKEAGGILQPLLARREGDSIIVVDGERRLRAAQRGGLKSVPVVLEDHNLTDAEVTFRQLTLDAQRVNLNAIERGRAIQLLIEQTGWTAAQAAVKLGLSSASVSRLLALLDLPADIQEQVAAGRLAMSAAVQLATIGEAEQRDALAGEPSSSGRLTRDALSRKIRRIQRGEQGATSGATRVTVMLGGGRSMTICGGGLSIETLVEWIEQLLAKARKARAQGLELATFAKMQRDQNRRAKGSATC